MNWLNSSFSICLISLGLNTNAQTFHYNLQQMLGENQIITVPAYSTAVLPGDKPGAITTRGIIWLKGIDFTDGTIDIDLRGKDVFLQSFLGIAFHGTDTSHCDIIYFRPFNFRHTDSARWKWSLAYMQIPDYNYARLRKEHPGVYENRIIPPPKADEWFHATIVINGRKASVYVNHNEAPSLEVTLLEGRSDGLFGLYSDGLTNDFANLTITKILPGMVRNNNIRSYDLQQLFKEDALETNNNNQAVLVAGTDKPAVRVSGIVWLKNNDFTKGTIDVDLRGKNEEGKSFLGIAFSGKDSNDYESVYFRPFNFKSMDPLKQKHMVQYMSLPDHDWQQLRTSQPLVFEHSVSPVPDPDGWFHATIVVSEDSVLVYVNKVSEHSLKIKRFRNHTGVKIGLWASALPGDFANLVIKP
jgi:hypothetical protein